MLPVVAIVGRPNVGKSTLFNRLLGERRAIVEDIPGVTRDRNYGEVTRYDRPFTLIDTGGFEPVSEERMLIQMREQSQLAMEEADLILFVMDGRGGLTPSDQEVAEMLRRVSKPVFFVVNKIDGEKQELAASEFYALGIAEIFSVSAEHGRGINDLVDRMIDEFPEGTTETIDKEETRLAVIGRPNVGKSSLVNRLLGFERVVANPISGTTRDSIDSRFRYNGKNYTLIDTAGIRRKGRVSQKLEKYSVIQALKAMDRAHVVLMVIDAKEGITDQDLAVAGYAVEKGRAVILVVNKWDTVEKDTDTMGSFVKDLRYRFKFLPQVPILFVSALSGQRVSKIMAAVEASAIEFNRRISTGELNRVLEQALTTHPPHLVRGRRLKFFYATQASVRPPTIVLFTNRPEDVHFSYQRYLSNSFREAFDFQSVPLRLVYRQRGEKKS